MNQRRLYGVTTAAFLIAIGFVALTGTVAASEAVMDHEAEANASASFDVSNLTVTEGETTTVGADIENPGDEPQIQRVELRVDGELIDHRRWALNPNETEPISFEVDSELLTEGSVVSVQTRTGGEVTTIEAAEASITFEDQVSDGTSAVVANASSSEQPYYVAVWTVDEDTGEPDMLLGAAQVLDNETSNLTVEFDGEIDENQTLIAAVHPDMDGDAATMDADTETILASDTANVTVEDDGVTGPPAITFEDQTSDGESVVVANVSNPGTPYYAAVWTIDDAGQPETLLGFEQLTDATASNLTVAFDEPINESQTLVAAVHPDGDEDPATLDPVTQAILASDTANVTVTDETEPPAPPAENASISFEDQTSDGANVTVANASNNETPYYTAVWTVNDTTGEPETLLGATQLNDSEATGIGVSFAEPITENQTLIAAVHPDADGNVSTVDPVTDDIRASDTANVTVENETEPPVENASINFEDQTSDGTEVSVASAANSETPYYAAVWTVDEAGQPETLLGATQINDPEDTDVPVTFDELLTENQTLVAAVHPDTDGDIVTMDPDTGTILASDTANVTVTDETEPPAPPAENASISFEDQTSDGANVTVANASNNETPYYTAVWTVNDTTGEPETLLGATQLNDSEATDVGVSFAEPITESQTLIAAVHPDADGNVSTVDPVTDDIRASDTANVTVENETEPPAPPAENASVTFEDQTSDGANVTVASASNNETPYYVAIGTANETTGEPESLLGFTQLNDTEATNISVALDQSITESQTLLATVHPDVDGDVSTVDPAVDTILASDDATVTVETGETASLVTVLR